MKDYVISIADDTKVNSILELLSDLSYVRIAEPEHRNPHTDFSWMNNPLHIVSL